MTVEKLDALKLETSAFKVLCFLAFKDGAYKPNQIAKEIGEKPSTVRARLTELKKQGLVAPAEGGYTTAITPYDILMKLYRNIDRKMG